MAQASLPNTARSLVLRTHYMQVICWLKGTRHHYSQKLSKAIYVKDELERQALSPGIIPK